MSDDKRKAQWKCRHRSLQVSHYTALQNEHHEEDSAPGVVWRTLTGDTESEKAAVDTIPEVEEARPRRPSAADLSMLLPSLTASSTSNASALPPPPQLRQLPPSTSFNSPNISTSDESSRCCERQAKLSFAPTFKRSFDRPNPSSIASSTQYNSCSNIFDQNPAHWRRRAGFSTAVGAEAHGGGVSMSRPGLACRSQQSSFDSNGDVAQISLNWMRVNGGMAPLRSLLQSSMKETRAASQSHLGRMCSLKRQQNVPSLESRRKDSRDGDQCSRKSVSLVLSNDVEAGRKGDDLNTPLMKDSEKNGNRLIIRGHLYEKRRVTSDRALFFALLGICVMILENELRSGRIILPGSFTSVSLKLLVISSTILLICFVSYFHVLEIKLFMNSNSLDDWRIALTAKRLVQFALEVSLCALCPFDLVPSRSHPQSQIWHTLDSLLSLAMFGRLFWLARVMLLHSRLFSDASSRSIAGLNRVNFNARFILKTLMTLCPGTMLMVFTASLWIIAGWILRLCERPYEEVGMASRALANSSAECGEFLSSEKRLMHGSYLNSLWMIAITFLSVGYGDIVPHTYCGRTMAVITGILGTCTSSMIVAVIARKLELTRAEKHVHNFMLDTQLSKQLKHSAANVLRETWLIYKYRRLTDKVDYSRVRQHQRKFLSAIYELRRVKREQRKLAENLVSLGDVSKTTSNTYELVAEVHGTQEGLALRVTSIEQQLAEISSELATLMQMMRHLNSAVAASNSSSSTGLRHRQSISPAD